VPGADVSNVRAASIGGEKVKKRDEITFTVKKKK
jgi:hypothetical protein